MAAKRKSALRSITPSETRTLLDDLKSQLAPISTALTEELAALLAAVLDDGRKQTLDRLSQALSDAVPEFLQRAFEEELLASGKSSSDYRALLAAVLPASEALVHSAPTGQTSAIDEEGSTVCAVGSVSYRENAPFQQTAFNSGEQRDSGCRQTEKVKSDRFGEGSW
ncbi:hypothetical protein FVF58_29545 [Paraburkholderia panacisoli]|uniref:Uncharacterized protein n=1 Tax=Paraburkholderia panacisoli TaxID=2603818 RepID=A0A5B0GR51_9BURK|nr:hypothetical protein [Paraburkholderia panacisoli]KAA1005363.1 hypothetical protein FVF58_29545 [Paraburkholderia panacisoli]